jgi:hypothetical protein
LVWRQEPQPAAAAPPRLELRSGEATPARLLAGQLALLPPGVARVTVGLGYVLATPLGYS